MNENIRRFNRTHVMMLLFIFQGQKYGWSRSQCDVAFRRDMEAACDAKLGRKKRSLWDSIINGIHVTSEISKLSSMSDGLAKCKQGAYVYYLSVKYFGGDNYISTSPSWCNDPCAKANGSPF